jgi:RNA polymerase sigma-70 factor (ECF subfamily)
LEVATAIEEWAVRIRRDVVPAVTQTSRNLNAPVTIEMNTDPELLLILAKAGSSRALVRLLDRCRVPLVEQARVHIGRQLRVKVDIEDLLQDVSLEAYRDIERFRGSTEREFLCWLRNILARILMNQLRRYFGTARRNLCREQPLIDADDSTGGRAVDPVAPDTSPSQRALKHESVGRLAEAIERLPVLYRKVIVLRHNEGRSFADVAHELGRTEDSVKNMWFRALRHLRGTLADLQ